MIKKSTRYLTLLVLFISMCFCVDAGNLKLGRGNKIAKEKRTTRPAPSQIIAFKIPQQIGPEVIVNDPVHGGYIRIPVHAVADVTAVIPTITTDPLNAVVMTDAPNPQNLTNAVGYKVDGVNYYSVQASPAAALAICNGSTALIQGYHIQDPPPAASYSWQMFDVATNGWLPAPGSIAAHAPNNYQTLTLASNPNAPKLYTFRRMIITNLGTAFDSYTDITVNPNTPITNNHLYDLGTTFYCGPSIPLLINGNIPSGGTGTITYQWQSSINGVDFTDIPGNSAKGQDYNSPAVTGTAWFRRLASSGACPIPVPSDNDVKITIQTGLGNNQISTTGPTTFCVSGNPGTIGGTPPTGGDGNYQYRWQSSPDGGTFNDIIPAVTSPTYNPGPVTTTTHYQRLVTSGACNTPSKSNTIVITIQTDLGHNAIQPPQVAAFCQIGAPGPIPGSIPTGGNNIYTFVWQSSVNGGPFIDIPNSNFQSYDPHTVTQTTSYKRSVISGACTMRSVSGPVTITITPAITSNVINQPPNAVYCATSPPVTITGLLAAGGNGPGSYTYKWQSSIDNGASYQDATLVNNQKDYATGVLTKTTYFRRIISSGACIGTSVTDPVIITVYQALGNNTLTPPAISSFCERGDADPITGTPPSGGDGNYTYQWQQSPTNTPALFTNISGQTGPSFNPPNLTSTMFYRRIVMNGICTTPLISPAVEIHITPEITGNTILTPPFSYCVSIDPEPISGSPPQGGDGPGSYSYKWYNSINNGLSWNLISGATGIDYDPPTIYITTLFRRDVISGTCVLPGSPRGIVVTQTPANVSVAPVQPICAGNKVTLSVISPDPTLSYTWYDTPTKNNVLSTNSLYTTHDLPASQTFYVEASNGTCSSPILTSATVTVIPLPAAPTLVTNPATTCQGTTATLNISGPQPGYKYNWYATATGGTPLLTNPSFTTPPITTGTTYYAEAINSSGCISATRTPVNVSPIPLAQVKLTGASVCPGETATITTDNNDPDVSINWYATATGGSILYTGNSFTPLPVAVSTTYYAEVANSCVPAVRASAQVKVIQPLPTPVVSVEAAVAPSITFRWATVLEATGYQVSVDDGQTFTDPSSGSTGTTHTVTGLQIGQSVTIIVRAAGGISCQLSNNSTPVTGTTTNPLIDNIFVANAFTPNGDGKNDIVYVHNENIKSLKFYVYDQWGELLYVSQSQQNGWDGTFKGKTEPAGVYVYYLEANMYDGKQVKKKGTITLLR